MTTATPSLTLRALLSQAAAKAALDRPAPVTAGLTPAGQGAGGRDRRARGATGVTLLVVPTDKDVEQMTADARFFYAALEGASDADVERAVLPFPSLQVDPYRGMTPHFRVAAARARALHAAATGSARLVVASAAALLPRVSPPERLLRASLEIRVGHRDRAARAGRSARRRRLHARGSGRRARRRSPSAAASSTSSRPATPSRCASSSSATWSSRCAASIPPRSARPGATDQVLDRSRPGTLRRRDADSIPVLDFLGATRGVQLLVSEHEQVEEQARKVREQLDVELRRRGRARPRRRAAARRRRSSPGRTSSRAPAARRGSRSWRSRRPEVASTSGCEPTLGRRPQRPSAS